MPSSRLKIIFAGTPQFAAKALSALIDSNQYDIVGVYTQPDRPAGRGKQLTASPVKQLALAKGLPIFQPLNFKNEADQAILQSLAADCMIVAAYGLILPAVILNMPRLGCLNIHASLLPRWRGAAPIQRAILAGDTRTGITIMQMDVGLDTGDMLYKVSCDIGPEDSGGSLHDKLAEMGAKAILTSFDQWASGQLTPEKQNPDEVTYAQKLSKEEARLNWQAPAEHLVRQVRAFNPWPVAYFHLGEERIRVWRASVEPSASVKEKPGTIKSISPKGICIQSGQADFNILEIQFPGGKVLSAKDVSNFSKKILVEGQVLESL